MIHAALLGVLILFTVLAYMRIGSFAARMNDENVFIYLVPIAAAAGYFLSKLVVRKRLESVSRDAPLQSKLAKYQSASLIQYALLEAPGFLALFAYLFSGNALHLVIAIALIAYLFAQRPTVEKIKKQLPLRLEERKQVDNWD